LGCAFGHSGGIIAQLSELGANRGGGGQLLVCIAALGDQLTAHLGAAQARVQPIIFEVRIRLALPIDDGSDIHQQVGPVFFCQFAASGSKCIQTPDATFYFVHPFADRFALPTEFAFGLTCTSKTQCFDRARHKLTAGTPLELLGRIDQQTLQILRQFHAFSPNRHALEYITLFWIFLSFCFPKSLAGWSPRYIPDSLLREAATRLQDRFLFGSDYPFISPQRWLKEFEAVKIDFKPEVREKILWRNAQKLLAHTSIVQMSFSS